MSEVPTRMSDRWWRRPGVRPRHRAYVWQSREHGLDAVRAAVRDAAATVDAEPPPGGRRTWPWPTATPTPPRRRCSPRCGRGRNPPPYGSATSTWWDRVAAVELGG